MRIATWNLNGLRAAWRKGLADEMQRLDVDVWLFQEIRCTPDQGPPPMEIAGLGFEHVAWRPAVKPGYAGTAVWSKRPISNVRTGLGERDADDEGRVLRVTIEPARAKTSRGGSSGGGGGVDVVSVYLPSGSSGDHRQAQKEAWMRRFRPWATKQLRGGPVVLAGDFNLAMTPRDLYYAKSNQKQSGYLPHERAWMTRLVESGWRDLVRESAGEVDGPYTWWSNRGQARALDRGWRIDYALANPGAAALVQGVTVERDASLGRDGGPAVSDHAPVVVELDF
ncbi:MAG: exodeoxyribonuclease III [Planctomycetota bacterium]